MTCHTRLRQWNQTTRRNIAYGMAETTPERAMRHSNIVNGIGRWVGIAALVLLATLVMRGMG